MRAARSTISTTSTEASKNGNPMLSICVAGAFALSAVAPASISQMEAADSVTVAKSSLGTSAPSKRSLGSKSSSLGGNKLGSSLGSGASTRNAKLGSSLASVSGVTSGTVKPQSAAASLSSLSGASKSLGGSSLAPRPVNGGSPMERNNMSSGDAEVDEILMDVEREAQAVSNETGVPVDQVLFTWSMLGVYILTVLSAISETVEKKSSSFGTIAENSAVSVGV